MENNNNILNLMLAHHGLLSALFMLFKDEFNEKSPKAEESFDEFVWETRKHFFVEENAIFDFLPLKTFGVFETISHLKDEHLTMLIDLKKISDNFAEAKKEDIEKFLEILEHHRILEEKELYPKLDKELRPEQKEQIIARINQFPINSKH